MQSSVTYQDIKRQGKIEGKIEELTVNTFNFDSIEDVELLLEDNG